jgi:hypothetical protein
MIAENYFDVSPPEMYEVLQRWLDKSTAFQEAVRYAAGDSKLVQGYDPELMHAPNPEAQTLLHILSKEGTQFDQGLGDGSYVCGNYGIGWLIIGEGCSFASASCTLLHHKDFMA